MREQGKQQVLVAGQTLQGFSDIGNLLLLRLGARHEQMVADFCEEALQALEADSGKANVVPLDDGKREKG